MRLEAENPHEAQKWFITVIRKDNVVTTSHALSTALLLHAFSFRAV